MESSGSGQTLESQPTKGEGYQYSNQDKQSFADCLKASTEGVACIFRLSEALCTHPCILRSTQRPLYFQERHLRQQEVAASRSAHQAES
jgi:hypothetical protein